MTEVAQSPTLNVETSDVAEEEREGSNSSVAETTVATRPQHTNTYPDERDAESKEEKSDRTVLGTGMRPSNPDPGEMRGTEPAVKVSAKPGLVIPSAIRISPVPKHAANRAAGAAQSTTQVVRPTPVKTELDATSERGLVPSIEATSIEATLHGPGEVQRPDESQKSIVKPTPPRSVDQMQQEVVLPHRPESSRSDSIARKRREAQVEFPQKVAAEPAEHESRPVPPMKPPVEDGDGPPPPTRHVQYANGGEQCESQKPRQHHHRSRQQGRTQSAASGPGASSLGRRPSRGLSAGIGVGVESGSETSHNAPPTPLFQRYVTDGVQEMKTLTRVIDKQNNRVKQLEDLHQELQKSLRHESHQRSELERMLADREKEWSAKCAILEKQRGEWENAIEEEKKKNNALQSSLAGLELDRQRILKKMRDPHMRGGMMLTLSERPSQSTTLPQPSSKSSSPSSGDEAKKRSHRSPQDYLARVGSVEHVRARNVSNSLRDFFGL